MSKADALALAQSLATSPPGPDDWPGISRSGLGASLIARINDPNLIDQKGTALCGPASFVRAVAMDMPVNYARCAIDLYKTGTGNIVGLDITPHRRMTRSPPKDGTDPADWIMAGGVRDDENAIFSMATPTKGGRSLAGMTLPGAMVKWFKSAGYRNISDSAHIARRSLATNLASARYASNLHSAGYRVVLLIDADILYFSSQGTDIIHFPNHWVTLASPIFNTATVNLDGPASFSIYTWGATRPLAEKPAMAPTMRRFLQKYFGFVAARL